MSVKHAVLGLVIERPGYGYELVQRMERRIGSWQASDSAVYPAMKILEREELIRPKRRESRGYKSVVWYEATEKGLEHFRSWMDAPSLAAPLREELLLKIALAKVEDLPRLIEVTREQERACLDRIMSLTQAGDEEEMLAREKDWPVIGELILRDAEVSHLQTTIRTLQRARSAMKRTCQRYADRASLPD